jgi:hypothetical protein
MSYTCLAKLVSLVSIILSLFSLRVAFLMVLSPFGLVHFDVWESISVVSNKFHFFCDICGWFFSYDMVIFYFSYTTSILLVSLYPLVLCLRHFLALFHTSLVFLCQRQCMMCYPTLVERNLWNWKWRPYIKIERGSWFHYRLVNRLMVANVFTRLSLIFMV